MVWGIQGYEVDLKGTARSALLAAVCANLVAAGAHAQLVKRDGPLSGRIVGAKGGEQARLAPAGQWRKAVQGQDLEAGDVLRTNTAGTLALLFADRTQVRLGPNATMVVNAVAAGVPSRLTLSAGKAWGRSPSAQTNLQIRTPSATAAIRGTEWAIGADDDNTMLEVFSGKVELGNELGSVMVGAGEAAHVRRGQAPIKVTISNPAGREQMLYFVRVEDALAMMDAPDRRFGEARRLVYAGRWEQAATLFAALGRAGDAATRAVGAYGGYVAGVQLGHAETPPPAEDEPNAVLGRALIAAYAGDLREALAIADAGLARFPDTRGLYRAKARIAFLLGQPEIARKAIDEALARHPGAPDLLGLRAEYLADHAGSPKAAKRVALAAVAARPEDADLQAGLAKIWFQLGGRREARRAVDRALAVRPRDAGLLALKADILMAQNEIGPARRALDDSLKLEPDLSIVRLGLAEYESRKGHRRAALDQALAASAQNPSFGRGFVTLAELSYDDRKPEVALQQLDAADRLDPFGPAVPLARTAIALYRFDADGAIVGARDALARYRGRGGEYSNLSENQQSGSLVSQSFRFLNLEGWGRYYGDRAFDSFSPVSYPDQVLNRTPSPFLIRALDGTFDSFDAADPEYVSSYLQGAVLAPLSVVNARRTLLFSRRDFFEGALGGSYLTESRRDYYAGQGTATGLVNGAIPVGYSLTIDGYRLDDTLPEVDVSPFVDRRRHDDKDVQAQIGVELTPQDKVVSILHYNDERQDNLLNNDVANLPQFPAGRFPVIGGRAINRSAALFWNHEFGYRDALTVGALYLDSTASAFYNFTDYGIENATVRLGQEHVLLTADYARSIGRVDIRGGVEFSRSDNSDDSIYRTDEIYGLTGKDCEQDPGLCEGLGYADGLFNIPSSSRLRYDDVRPYLDVRAEVGNALILQGQAAYLRRTIRDIGSDPATPRSPTYSSNHLEYQLGAAVAPLAGQWLRAAVLSGVATDQDFTFAPIAAVGLRGTIAPVRESSRVVSYVARWDAEWTSHLFTNVEIERQTFGALSYAVPSTEITVAGGKADLTRISLEADLWLRGNLGLRVAYAHTEAHARDAYVTSAFDLSSPFNVSFVAGDRLPYVPRDTGQLALTWTIAAPWRSRVEASVDYLGQQISGDGATLPGYPLFNLKAEFEPFARAIRIEAGVFNLLDRRFVEGPGVTGPGRTGRVAVTFRF